MTARLLLAVGFAIGIAAWVALLWLLVTGARVAAGNALAAYRELRTRTAAAAAEEAVASLDAKRREREERVRRRAATRRRRVAA